MNTGPLQSLSPTLIGYLKTWTPRGQTGLRDRHPCGTAELVVPVALSWWAASSAELQKASDEKPANPDLEMDN